MGLMDLGAGGLCCTLADGAGGHGHGELAAQLTVQAVVDGFRQNPLFAPASLASLISQAEHRVSGQQSTSVSRMHMSATVVVLCIDPEQGRALWAHWGDSRLYWFRAGRMHLRTEDHSLVQQLLHAGLYEENDPRRLPNRNVLAGAIGAEGQVPPSIRADAVALEAGDVFPAVLGRPVGRHARVGNGAVAGRQPAPRRMDTAHGRPRRIQRQSAPGQPQRADGVDLPA